MHAMEIERDRERILEKSNKDNKSHVRVMSTINAIRYGPAYTCMVDGSIDWGNLDELDRPS
jgi:hypothetical protein